MHTKTFSSHLVFSLSDIYWIKDLICLSFVLLSFKSSYFVPKDHRQILLIFYHQTHMDHHIN